MGYEFYPSEQDGILVAKQASSGIPGADGYISAEQATINVLVAEAEANGLFKSISSPGRYLGFNLSGATNSDVALNNTRAVAVIWTAPDRPVGAPSIESDRTLIDSICATFPPNT